MPRDRGQREESYTVARRFCRARRARARHPCTPLYLLLPLPLKKAVCYRYRSHGDSAVRGAPSTHSPLSSSPSSLEKSSVLPLSAAGCRAVGDREDFTQGSHGDSAVRGAPERAIHALPSTFFSLSSTLDAHCIVTTHYPLPSSPYSLLHCLLLS